jgi:uncharacterized protein
MYIDLLKLPKEGKKLCLAFNESFCDTLFNIKCFTGEIFKEKDEFILHGELSFEVEEQCDRCLEHFILSMNEYIILKLSDKFCKVDISGKPEIQLSDEDLDRLYIDNNIIIINILILEEAESLRPISKLCNSECKGLCKYCGLNMNKHVCDCDHLIKEHFSMEDLVNKYNKK